MNSSHIKLFSIVIAYAICASLGTMSNAEEAIADESYSLCLQNQREQLTDEIDRALPQRLQLRMPPDGVEFTNDAGIRIVAENQVNRLIKGDNAIGCSVLARQAERSKCELSLLSEGRKQVASQKLYVDGCKSIVVIFVSRKHNDHWHVVSAATGFFIAKGVIATNHHVFEEKDEYMFAMTADTKVHPIKEVLATNIENDTALCRIEADGYKPLALRKELPVGAPVRVISHPKGRFYTLSQGLVSRRYLRLPSRSKKLGEEQTPDGKASDENHVRKSVTMWVTITAGFGLGSSGAPVFDRFGNVVGMATSTQSIRVGSDDDQFSQMVFRDCVPSEVLQAMVEQPAVDSNRRIRQPVGRE